MHRGGGGDGRHAPLPVGNPAAATAVRERTVRRATRTRDTSRAASRAASGRRSPRGGHRPCRPVTQPVGSGSVDGTQVRTARPWASDGNRSTPADTSHGVRRDNAARSRSRLSSALDNVAVGEKHRLAVLEMNKRPGEWRIWLDGQPVTDPIVLEGSHKQWRPIATAESWNGGVQTCNGFGFRFERVGVARSLGGSWQESYRARRFASRLRHSTASAGAQPRTNARLRSDRTVRLHASAY